VPAPPSAVARDVFELNFNGRQGAEKVTYGDVFLQAEQEYSRHNFEYADTDMLFEQFRMAEAACKRYLEAGWQLDPDLAPQAGEGREAARNRGRHLMALPAYDQCIKASHVFNLLDARGVISVTERQSYILRVRELNVVSTSREGDISDPAREIWRRDISAK
jgi:glycyl-tRNA synthetase alpha chain